MNHSFWNEGQPSRPEGAQRASVHGDGPRTLSKPSGRAELWRCGAARTAFLLLLLVAAASSAFARAERALPELQGPSPEGIYEARLENGLGILIKEVQTSPVVCVSVWYRAGTRNESNGTTGLAHLLEHMMYKGTAQYGKGVYDNLLEANGGVNNATTWNDRTNYYATIAKEKVDLALELEADRMRGALFTEQDLEDEMPVVRNEMEKGEDDPYTELDERIASVAILEHPYHWPTIGWKSDVESITAEQIHDYYDRFYQPNNAYLVLVGDLPPAVLLEKAVHYFEDIPAGPEPDPIVTVEPPQKGERRFLLRETGSTRLLGIAYRTPEGMHPDTRPLEVLGRVLTGGKASRLHRALVDTGQAVWVAAYPVAFEDPFLFFVYAMLTEDADADQVESTIYAEIERVIETPPDDAELARVKKQAKVETLFSRDDVESVMFGIGEAEALGTYGLYDDYLGSLDAVSAEDVQRVAAEYFVADARTVGFYLPHDSEGGRSFARREDSADSDTEAAGESMSTPEGGPTQIADDRAAMEGEVARDAQSAVATAAPIDGPTTSPVETRTDRAVLSNGVVLLTRESHDNPTIAVRGRCQGGLLTEAIGKEGVAGVVAETMPLGAGEWDAAAVVERLESLGATLEFDVRPDAIEFELRCLAEDFAAATDILGEVLLHPRFDEEPVERAKQRLVARLREHQEDTFQVAYHRGLEELYGVGSPFARFVEGSVSSLESLGRDDLVQYHETLLSGSRWTIAAVGDLTAGEARSRFESVLADLPVGAPLAGVEPTLETPEAGVDIIRVPMEDRSQVDLVFLGPGVAPSAPGRAAADVANVVLGGAFTSRLNRTLRDDEGLTYWAGSYFADLGRGSHWVATLGVNPENVQAALDGTLRELREFVRGGVDDEELGRAKEYAAGSFPIGLATKSDVAEALLDAEAAGYGVDYIETRGNVLRAQDEPAVEAVSAKFANPDRLVIVMAGSFGSE
ncbi:MAG: insulinase family protein [Candidatus Eisenbacteria bacterium]|uniref:Insulinase family protein n=1 Tax=Eiseniibacteriota bacterium TaxID=2212470 RepID=A0A956N923_UNCEI|nr:insulinase family protein [Candidatus Eisenbacteria bacterium]MCB9465203.1 insulinase family protein [Candidatus Eisenbacteria bacterium]